ncbi:unnamed protein product [Cochlearia groenlandica]
MAIQIIASSSSSSPTITKSHLSSCLSLMGSSSRLSHYIGLNHMGISISPKSSNPGIDFSISSIKSIPFSVSISEICAEKKKKKIVIGASLFVVGAHEALVVGVVALYLGILERLYVSFSLQLESYRMFQEISKSTLEHEIGIVDISTPIMYNPNRTSPGLLPRTPPSSSVSSTEDPLPASDPSEFSKFTMRTAREATAASPPGQD